MNKNNMKTEVESEKLELSAIDCSEDSIQRLESNISFEEKVKKSSNGYAETSLDEATNYSLLCEDDDNGEKVLTGDTTQTYCTEGTPYNFSNAASYTDLRKCGIDDKVIQVEGYLFLILQSPNNYILLKIYRQTLHFFFILMLL